MLPGMNKLPPKTALYLLIGVGVLALFVLVGVIPMQQHLHDLDGKIEQAKYRIEEQSALHPIYLKMLSIAAADGVKAPPVPERQGLGQKAVSEITDSLAQLVVKSGLEAQSVTPDPGSLGKGSKSLSVNIHVRGPLEKLRAFLGDLAMLPAYENMENVKIQPGAGPRDCTLKVWLAAE